MTAKKPLKCLALLALLGAGFAAPAFAADSWTWKASTCSQTVSGGTVAGPNGNVSNIGNAYGCGATSGSVANNATLTGWSTTGFSGASSSSYDKASVRRYDGVEFGIVNDYNETSSSGQHSVDNNTHTDSLLIKFDSAVALNALNIGWRTNDADITILRYVGADAPNIQGKTTADIKADIIDGNGQGWELVANLFDLAASQNTNNPSATFNNNADASKNKSSSWWLISAFNSNLGGVTGDSNKDYFKLFSFAGAGKQEPSTGIPEPASLALAAAALLALRVTRRSSPRA